MTCLQHRIEEHGERSVTCEDIRLIMPTVLILLFTILVLSTVIPYAFSTAIKQLRDLQAREAAGRERERERESFGNNPMNPKCGISYLDKFCLLSSIYFDVPFVEIPHRNFVYTSIIRGSRKCDGDH